MKARRAEEEMLQGFEALDSRIHTTHGLRCIEPPGQDGYNCLLLAAIDQLRLLFATADIWHGGAPHSGERVSG